MTDRSRDDLESYFTELLRALGTKHGSAAAEIRDDAETRLLARVRAGEDARAAEAAIIEDLGNPFELAHRIRTTRAPIGGALETRLRTIFLFLIVGWMLLIGWSVRPWDYGTRGTLGLLFMVAIHAPFALLVAPRVVWRKNWLFLPVISFAAGGVLFFLAFGGQSSSSELAEVTAQPGSPPAPAAPAPPEEPLIPRRTAYVLALVAFNGLLIAAMQQRRQRLVAAAGLGAVVLAVEIPFRIEEALFARDVADARAALELLTDDWSDASSEETAQRFDLRLRGTASTYSLHRARPLQTSSGLIYSSTSDRFSAHD